jgi:hypothetical protein
VDFLTPAERRRLDAARNAAQRQRQSVQQAVQQHPVYDPEVVAERMLAAAEHLPTVPSWMHSAYALGQIDVQQLENLAMQHQRDSVEDTAAEGFFGGVGSALHGAWFGTWHNVIQPLVRAGVLGIDTIAQEVLQRPATAAITSAMDPDLSFGEAYDQYGPSTGVQAASEVLAGQPLDLGEGLFPGGGAHERGPGSRELEIRGQPATMGGAMVEGMTQGAQAVGVHPGLTPAAGMAFIVESIQSPVKGYQFVQEMAGGADPGQHVFEKASGAYQFVADVALDPSMWGIRGAARGVRHVKGIDAGHRSLGSAIRATSQDMAIRHLDAVDKAGLISGSRRNTVLIERAEKLFRNERLIKKLAESDLFDIHRNLRLDRIQHRGNNLDDFAKSLANMTDETEIAEFLLKQVRDGYIYERGFYQGVGSFNAVNPRQQWKAMQSQGWFSGTETRYGGLNPSQIVSVDDRMHAMHHIDEWLRLGKVSIEDRRVLFHDAAYANSNAELLHVVSRGAEKMLARVDDLPTVVPKIGGRSIDHVKEWKSIVDAQIDGVERVTRTYARKEGQDLLPPWAKALNETQIPMPDGTTMTVVKPAAGMITDGMNSGVNLLDPQAVRRATTDSAIARYLYETNGWKGFEKFNRYLTSRVFKPLALFTRPSYTVRNNIDNNLRMAGAGYSSIFTPEGYWGAVNANRKGMFDMVFSKSKHVEEGTLVKFKGGKYGTVEHIDDSGNVVGTFRIPGQADEAFTMSRKEMERVMEGTSNIVNETFTELKALTDSASGLHFKSSNAAAYTNSMRPYHKGIDENYVIAWQDELIRMHSDPIYRAFANKEFTTRGELLDHLMERKLGELLADTLGDNADKFLRPTGGHVVTRARLEAYLDTYVVPHIDEVTGNNPELFQAIFTGRLANGATLTKKEASQRLGQELFQFGPRDVRGSAYLSPETGFKGAWEASMDFLAEWTATRPENYFTRFPLMVQVWADDIARSMKSVANDKLRQEIIERAVAVGMPKQQVAVLQRAANGAKGYKGALDDIDGIFEATKFHAADKTREIAFDASSRGSFQEAFDAWAPFYDAWIEVATSWGRIIRDNPNVFVRGTNTYRALRTAGVFTMDEHGQEVFQYPGGGALASLLGLENGRMVPLGSVAGANMIVQGVGPGYGPVVQWPAAAFIPSNPEWQWLRDHVLPFGSKIDNARDFFDPNKGIHQLYSSLTPAWAQKAMNAITDGGWDEHQWNTAVGHAMTALGTTHAHKYDMTTVEGMAEFRDDAIDLARWTLLFRSFMQWNMPTGPRIEWDIKVDPEGDWHRVNSLASLYFDMLEQSGGDEQVAVTLFTELVGTSPHWIAQGSTRQVRPSPRTREGQDWLHHNKDVAESYPDVISYFAPSGVLDNPTDYNTIRNLIEKGHIQSLSPDQQVQLVRMNQAFSILNGQRNKIAHLPSGQQDQIMGVVRDWLDDKYPGWNSGIEGLHERRDRPFRIAQLDKASQDPRLADSLVNRPLKVYLQKRREAMQIIAERAAQGGDKTITAQSNNDVRMWLHQIGQGIAVTDPQFRAVWTSLLAWEVSE